MWVRDFSVFLKKKFPFLFNAQQVRVSSVLTNAPYLLNLDCDHYINNSKALRESMCFMMDPLIGKKVCYVQFPQRFDGIDRNDRYANRNTVFFDVSMDFQAFKPVPTLFFSVGFSFRLFTSD